MLEIIQEELLKSDKRILIDSSKNILTGNNTLTVSWLDLFTLDGRWQSRQH